MPFALSLPPRQAGDDWKAAEEGIVLEVCLSASSAASIVVDDADGHCRVVIGTEDLRVGHVIHKALPPHWPSHVLVWAEGEIGVSRPQREGKDSVRSVGGGCVSAFGWIFASSAFGVVV